MIIAAFYAGRACATRMAAMIGTAMGRRALRPSGEGVQSPKKSEEGGMDRREAMGLGLAGGLAGALLPRAAWGQEHETGYLPGDSQEFIGLWPGTPPGGDGIHLDLKISDAVQPDGFHVRAV